MAKKKANTSNVYGLLAFIALIVKAAAYILGHFGLGLGSLTFIADIILTGMALLIAWSFAKTCNKGWRIVYLVILILVIIGFVFGGIDLL